MKRLFIVFTLLASLFGTAQAMRLSTFYEFGFSRTGPFVASVTDSIPFGTTFRTHWIPIYGARLVKFNMRASNADSDSVVTIKVASADTVLGLSVAIDTSSTVISSVANSSFLPGQGIHIMSNYIGSGGVSWDPAFARGIYVVPLVSPTAQFPFIPQRWIRYTVIAPTRLCTAASTAAACNSMHNVRIWVEVFYDDNLNGQDPYYPIKGAVNY